MVLNQAGGCWSLAFPPSLDYVNLLTWQYAPFPASTQAWEGCAGLNSSLAAAGHVLTKWWKSADLPLQSVYRVPQLCQLRRLLWGHRHHGFRWHLSGKIVVQVIGFPFDH